MIDKRFLDTKISISGIVASYPNNPAEGSQFLVQCNSNSGNIPAQFDNYIIRFNGAKWLFIPPRIDMPEVINELDGRVLSYDGSKWQHSIRFGIVLVDDIIDFDYTGEQDSQINNIAGTKFISTGECGDFKRNFLYCSTGIGMTCSAGYQSGNMTFACSADSRIYSCDSSFQWHISKPLSPSCVVASHLTGGLYMHDGSHWGCIRSEHIIVIDEMVLFNHHETTADYALASVLGNKYVKLTSDKTPYVYTVTSGETDAKRTINQGELIGIIEQGIIWSYGTYMDNVVPSNSIIPSAKTAVFSKADGAVYYFDTSTRKFVKAGPSETNKYKLVNEFFVIKQSSTKFVTLSHRVHAHFPVIMFHQRFKKAYLAWNNVNQSTPYFNAAYEYVDWGNCLIERDAAMLPDEVICIQYTEDAE